MDFVDELQDDVAWRCSWQFELLASTSLAYLCFLLLVGDAWALDLPPLSLSSSSSKLPNKVSPLPVFSPTLYAFPKPCMRINLNKPCQNLMTPKTLNQQTFCEDSTRREASLDVEDPPAETLGRKQSA